VITCRHLAIDQGSHDFAVQINVSGYTNEANATTGIAKAAANQAAESAMNSGVIPEGIFLAQNYPNPFSASRTFGNPSTTISHYALSRSAACSSGPSKRRFFWLRIALTL
jgi:hypothetical protein